MADDNGGGPSCGPKVLTLSELYDEAFRFAEQAVIQERQCNWWSSVLFLAEAVEVFLRVLDLESDERRRGLVERHLEESLAKIDVLRKRSAAAPQPGTLKSRPKGNSSNAKPDISSSVSSMADVASFVLEQAIAEDENQSKRQNLGLPLGDGGFKDVIVLYMDAAESLLKALRFEGDLAKQDLMKRRLESVISRAEELKRNAGEVIVSEMVKGGGSSAEGSRVEKAGTLSAPEKKILVARSRINGKMFVPFLETDKRERFVSSLGLFTDPDGMLSLSAQQKEAFHSWRRPVDVRCRGKRGGLRVVDIVSQYSIKQTIISDCSFVASLSCCAAFERMFNSRVITSIVYPQNRKNEPVVSASGKYVVRLRFNGIDRKIVIDDFLPTDDRGEVLCSHSVSPGELWVSLIEKAYLKLHGGYDFPGSNSGVDLHALIGWIPERFDLSKINGQKERMAVWQRMQDGWRLGQCLVTVSTKELSKEKEKEFGLVSSHSYAVLRFATVDSLQLMQLKNPWSHKRWKGAYGENDSARWTPELQARIGYDSLKHLDQDNGVFWIDFDSICQFFPDGYFSWNPSLFAYQTTIHSKFERGVPINDKYNYERDPQFSLSLSSSGVVWVLLNKHVNSTDEKDRDFITLHVFDNRNGRKVYYPSNPLIMGTYRNSPFNLVKIPLDGTKKVTVVVSQYETKFAVSFSLFFYSTVFFKVSQLPFQFRFNHRVESQWTHLNACGPVNSSDYANNPKYLLKFRDRGHSVAPSVRTELFVKLEVSVGCYVNIRIYNVKSDRVLDRSLMWLSSGDYREGFCYIENESTQVVTVREGEDNLMRELIIIVSTFERGETSPFFLTVGSSTVDFTLRAL